ncbi:hypothetical protein B0H63DRAFT_454616 [Podospora didyma]|uniref:IBR domain-containing protein n=1 Tax=Podospora didyma TaxID=330526 RepID=A0AAE0K5I9_9PEZI|nr:hypothetical protein B0H63DRAFT_454616 [Podospora didyma]
MPAGCGCCHYIASRCNIHDGSGEICWDFIVRPWVQEGGAYQDSSEAVGWVGLLEDIHLRGEATFEWKCVKCARNCYVCNDVEISVYAHLQRADEDRAALSKRLEEERKSKAATEAYLVKISKLCPMKGCGARIQCTAGCDHMRCRNCGTHFCWTCNLMSQDGHLRSSRCQRDITLQDLRKANYAVGWRDNGQYDNCTALNWRRY